MLSFNLLRFISTPYNRSLACVGVTLDINKEKYTKLSVVLFPVVLKVVNFLLPYFAQLFPFCVENLLSGYSPPIMQGATARNSVEVCFCCFLLCLVLLLQLYQRFLLLWLCSNVLRLLGNVVRVYPRIVQGLTFLLV